MKELINLKIDYAFKLIFGKEGNEAILIAFLNAALQLPQKSRIEGITIMNSELNKEYHDDKKSILDVRAVTIEGMQINIEIQLSNQYDIEKRSLFYWAEMYSRQMREGMAYKELAKAVTINILDFNYLNQTKNYHSVFHLYEDEERFQLTEALEMHFMELPKLVSKWRRREVSPWENGLVRWLLLLEGSENQEILRTLEEIAMQDPVLHQAIAAWEKSSDDPNVREEYFARRKAVLDEKAAVREAELRLREAIQKGMAEGRAEGKAEVAKNLLDLGMEISKVVKATGMTEDEVKGLKD
ncbi:Rpn family recombination-promoting nuclease/putative transposase [Desulfosporosinus fructosivorans]|uniref:Rpn family recombination-promoting nuclease/putative transposase n=1 Tax=Desulfosporosinus fructosivorans TaxID=2018669 RepID=A0A4Z0QZX4_9FIRM|nr:Rpn family recombination-promoting nuclease/putative transposase [Desulfosporosinus fructosivorans]TGE36058.1 Rpn family recombination-promoting nuclease/putative transposase [Desulfosporosinus fructosivorans]